MSVEGDLAMGGQRGDAGAAEFGELRYEPEIEARGGLGNGPRIALSKGCHRVGREEGIFFCRTWQCCCKGGGVDSFLSYAKWALPVGRIMQETSLFLDACHGRPTPRTPVWMMRQAGRYLPQYRRVRAGVDFLTLCRTPSLAAEVTLQPVDELGVDAAVIFSDILVVLEAMGLPIEFPEQGGPKLARTVSSPGAVEELHIAEPEKQLSYVGEAISLCVEQLRGRGVPVLGFAGAPFTLACYAIEGKTSRDFTAARQFFYQYPEVGTQLLEKIGESVALHLEMQVRAGAAAVQVFESWGGLLGQSFYRERVLPVMRQVIARVQSLGVPVIFYLNGSVQHLESMAGSGADVLSVDWRLPLREVRERVGTEVSLQGNLDPVALHSTPDAIAQQVREMFSGLDMRGIVGNLGHGIGSETPVENARAFVKAVQGYRA